MRKLITDNFTIKFAVSSLSNQLGKRKGINEQPHQSPNKFNPYKTN